MPFNGRGKDTHGKGTLVSEESEKKKKQSDAEDAFPIRDFPDLRRLRKSYIRNGDKPIAVDSSGNPQPDATERDFGLTRTTEEEAIEFLRQLTNENEEGEGNDPLTEFLDDE